MEICIDFDGTCVTHDYPNTGADIGAAPVLKALVAKGHKLILFTMRCDSGVKSGLFTSGLTDAVNWFRKNKIPLYGIQTNPTQQAWTQSPKAYGQLYIDDAALGCPLKVNSKLSARPFVDWNKVEKQLIKLKIL